jgi:hypothetical protein
VKKIVILISIALIFSIVFAENAPKNMGIYIKPNGVVPAEGDVTFSVYVIGRSSETLTQVDVGCGYTALSGMGLCYVNLSAFPTQWTLNENLYWTVSVSGSTLGNVNQNIDSGDGESQFTTSSWGDPFFLPVTLSSFMASFTDGTPTLLWATQSEVNNAGWNIYRSETEDQNESLQINPELILGAGTTSETTEYIFIDEYDVEYGTTYRYTLESVDFSGNTESYGPIILEIPEDDGTTTPEVPPVYGLHSNYPNPFNPDTTISFVLEKPAKVNLSIYNVKGQKVITLCNNFVDKVNEPISYHWNGIDSRGNSVGSGMYFYNLQINGGNQTKKMVLIK